jgi:hypothetical protein
MAGKWFDDGLRGLLVAVMMIAVIISALVGIAVSAPTVAAQDTEITTENSTGDNQDPGSDDIGSVNFLVGGDSSESDVTDTIEREISSTTRVYGVSDPEDGMVTVTLEVDRTSRVTLTDGMSGYNNGGGEFVTRSFTLNDGIHEIEFPLQTWNGAMALTIADSDAAHGFSVEPPRKSPFAHLGSVGIYGIIVTGIISGSYPAYLAWRREQREADAMERVL